ncbi:MAG TPA: wax ester/triacylglycerol synthase family O-acyltransferase [Actinomycetes bacterium]|jgi:WS/DGAT/MGAT family acyltransferase|nr:wax ester/triacylglycerol synthase family O-acyltransferase [Actinomycetes bacterium]
MGTSAMEGAFAAMERQVAARQRADGSARAGPLERLSPLDVSNLRVEDHGLPMHVAALAILEAAPLLDAAGQLRLDALREHLERRLHLAPRLRQVLSRPRFGLGPPLWVDAAAFDIREHVRTRAIPAPGDEAGLLEVCSQLNQPPLDRSRPLWELWLLTGLADGTVGLLIRLHHVVADGIAALALMGALFDAVPDAPSPVAQPWMPRPVPGAWELFSDNLRRQRGALASALSAVRRPALPLERLLSPVRQLRRLRRQGFAPRVSLNRPVGSHRRLLLVRADLGRVKEVAHAHGAKVNDVVLAAVAGGARRLLEARGELQPGLVLSASVAVSVRSPAEQRAGGNRVGIMLVPLPVGEPDPVRRLERIAQATAEAKRQPAYQPGARFLQRWMVHAMFRQRLVNLLVSNLPGPAVHLYLYGARVLDLFQVGIVQGNITVSVGVLSYAGQLNFDLVSDADAVPDSAVFAQGLADALG